MRDNKILPVLTKKLVDKFWGKVNFDQNIDVCWEWVGTLNPYGVFYINRNPYKAHRIAYLLSTNIDPKEMLICHTCDNPKCVNPSHFFLGTTKDNAQDALKKGRVGDNRLKDYIKLHPESISRGEKNGQSKVNIDQVINMRDEYATGSTSLIKLGKKYNLKDSTVFSIIHKKTWKHI